MDLDGGVKVLPAQEEGGKYPVRETESSAIQLLCLSYVIKFTGHSLIPSLWKTPHNHKIDLQN